VPPTRRFERAPFRFRNGALFICASFIVLLRNVRKWYDFMI
jgi:hypothetical protein